MPSNRYKNRNSSILSLPSSSQSRSKSDYHLIAGNLRYHVNSNAATAAVVVDSKNGKSSTTTTAGMSDFAQLANFETKTMLRLRNVGSLLSGLSKSNLRKGRNTSNIIQSKRETIKLSKKEHGEYQSKLNKIKTMKQAYMQNNQTSEEERDDKNFTDIKRCNKQRQMNHHIDFPKQKGNPDPTESIIENDKSMREMIDWLENVDLNGIHDFM